MIAIKEDLYEKLLLLKKKNQSFSDVIENLINLREKSPLSHFGIGKDMDPHDLDQYEAFLTENRKQSRENSKLIDI